MLADGRGRLSSEQDRRSQVDTEGARGHCLGLTGHFHSPAQSLQSRAEDAASPGESRLAPAGQEGPITLPQHHSVPVAGDGSHVYSEDKPNGQKT